MHAARVALALFIAFSVPTISSGTDKAEKVETRSVTARVVSAVGEGVGIRAKKVPGEFSIPEGSRAFDFKYSFVDPKSGIKLDKLSGSNIYSVSEKRYITEAANGPDFELPHGKYKFVVGGGPGAVGSLSFRVAPMQGNADDEGLAKDADRVIDIVLWNNVLAEVKTHETYYVHGGKVTGRFDQTYPALGITAKGTVIEPPRHQGTFNGKIDGNVITGTWKVVFLPQRATFTDDKGVQRVRMNDGEMTITTRTVLSQDGTLSETAQGSGTTRLEWTEGPRPAGVPQQTTDSFDYTVPCDLMPQPHTGTWKDRK